MARSFPNIELAALIAKYTRYGFVPTIVPDPETPVAHTPQDTEDIVRAISENALRKQQPRKRR